MFHRQRTLAFAFCLLLAGSIAIPAAAQRSWDGGNGTDVWGDNGNWSPDGSPAGTDVSIGNLVAGATTKLNNAFSINSLTITNGADVINSTDDGATNDFRLLVNGLTTISDAGSTITIYGGDPEGLDTDNLTINSGATVSLNSQTVQGQAILQVDGGTGTGLLDLNSGGTLSGNGLIQLNAAPAAAAVLLSNDGTLTARAFGPLIIPPTTTLQITATSANALVDLDGTGGAGVVNTSGNATLDIDVPINDAFSGTINMSAGSTLDIAGAWSIDIGTVNINTPGVFVGSKGAAAHLAGGAVTMTGGSINLDDIDSVVLDTALTTTGGTINNSGSITVNSVSTVGAGTTFNMTGTEATLTINGTLNVDSPAFNLDGAGAATNVTTVSAGGILDLDLGAGADEDFQHTINLNGGELDVTTLDNNWSLNAAGVITAGGAGISTINGETFQIVGTGGINVLANSVLNVNAVTEITGSADFTVAAGGALNFGAVTYNNTTATFTGAGILRKGTATIDAVTTWNVDQLDLDDGNTTLNANLTINADTVEPDGDGVDNTHTINDLRLLTVNISGGGHWTLDFGGTIVYNGNAATDSYLAGSDLTMNGTINHTGDGRIDARIDIGSTGIVNILTAAEPLRLSGGTLANPNTIAGGTINGPGLLGADTGSALVGFGTISADIDFDLTSDLKADNGILSLTAGTAILDVNEIGTAAADGILEVGSPWNTNVTARVRLAGGEVRGAAITNDGANGIIGFGTLSAPVNNNTRIDADVGQLIVQTPLNNNDWDGSGNTGALNAFTGNLEVRDNATFLFSGSANAANGRTLFANGFALEFEPASTLALSQGFYRSTNSTNIGGTVTVGAGDSGMQITGTATFEAGSNTTITGNLQLDNTTTRINAGAVFSGGGSLINLPGRTLTLIDGADVDVLVENQGTLVLGASAGQTTGLDFEQTATGAWNVELGGTGLNDYDRMTLTGLAAVDGILNLSLIGGYVPTLADPLLTILSASSVSGTFDVVNQPPTMPPTLMFDVIYNAGNVQLDVVALLLGDYNRNGTVEASDYVLWRKTLGNAVIAFSGADGDGDGTIDNDDYNVWRSHFGDALFGSASRQAAAVPEPGSAALTICAIAGLLSIRSRGVKR